MGYGKNIRAARKRACLTQEELAQRCGMATITIRQYESERREPRFAQLNLIADTLGISYFELADDGIIADVVKEDFEASNKLYRIQELFKKLNRDGQQKAIERIEELIEIPRYQAGQPVQESTKEQSSTSKSKDIVLGQKA